MGRMSTKEDKNVYQLSREELGYSREKAAMLLETISEDRIGRIELKNLAPHPDEVVVMAEKYKNPSLCNYYCSNQCPIGKHKESEVKVSKIEFKELPTIVLQTIVALNAMNKQKARFMEITADCKVDENELNDFNDIRNALNRISASVEDLRLQVERAALEEGHHPSGWQDNQLPTA